MVKGKKKPMKKKKQKKSQNGGFIPAAVASVASTLHTLGQKYKPVSALDDFLVSRNLKSDGSSLAGKIANAAISVGKSLGYGQSGGMSMPPTVPSAGRNQVSMAGSGRMARLVKVI